MKTKAELVFIPAPGMGHFMSTTEFAKSLLDRDDRLSITVLVIHPPGSSPAIETKVHSLAASDTRIRCITIPPVEPPSSIKSSEKFLSEFIASHKPHVEHVIKTELSLPNDPVHLVGIVVDLFCTSMIDVGNQLKIPSYIFFTSGAAFLGFMLYLPVHHNQFGVDQFDDQSNIESIVPTYTNPVPTNVLPSYAFNKEGYSAFLYHGTKFGETKGFIINTFAELEPYAISSLMMMAPPVIYPVGPSLDLSVKEKSGSKRDEIMNWLNDQPPASVVFLCFGSAGSLDDPQLQQMAIALEGSGQRFLWSIRRPPPTGTFEQPTEYEDVREALPEGYLERTRNRGMVCGWAPQVEVLAHPAVGGFVSHCGWNSILESIWYGVPIATWPLYAEQQINAFQLVQELGLAVELKLDYRLGSGEVVMADEIERAITFLMDKDNPVRNKVKQMSEKSRKAVEHGGSSYASLGRLIEDLLGNVEVIDN